jgi:hypothetical protein
MRNRLTLVVSKSSRSWNRAGMMFVSSLAAVHAAATANDVERIIVDRCATADEYLHLLASLPEVVAGDVMLLRNDGGAFLSSAGRGGDRVMYALSAADVDFYFQTHGLAVTRLALTA